MAKILIVDDYQQIRAAARRILAKDGHEVWDVPDGVQALALLDIIAFDLVLTDVYMAAVDGMELLVRIQQRGHRMPVVVMSGGGFASREEVLAMASECGAVAILAKPFTPRQLRETVRPLLKPSPPA
jgi:DNA-binding NtrC family response regulator